MGGKQSGAKPSEQRVARNARSKAQINLAKALASVFSAGVYNKEDLQAAVCTFVSEMKEGGETERTQILLADMVTWCLAEYYRESA